MKGWAQVFYAEDAEKYGLAGATMLNHFRHWLQAHMSHGRNIHDGEVWNYISVKKMAEIYPYWTEKQVRTTLAKLEEQGAIKRGNYNQSKYDRTLWYTIPGFLEASHFRPLDLPPGENGSGGNGEPIPEAYQNPNTEEDSPPDPPDDVQQAYDTYCESARQHGWVVPKSTKPAKSRVPKLRARLRDAGGLAGWREAVARVARSPFLMGKTDHNFRMHLDFLLQESSFLKLTEGRYDGPDKPEGPQFMEW